MSVSSQVPGLGLPPPTMEKPGFFFFFFFCHADPWVSVLGGPFLDSLCELLALYDLQLILLGVWQPHPASPDPVCPLGEGWGGPGGMGPDFQKERAQWWSHGTRGL